MNQKTISRVVEARCSETCGYRANKITCFLKGPVGKLDLDPGLTLSETGKNERFLRCPRRESAGREAGHKETDQRSWL